MAGKLSQLSSNTPTASSGAGEPINPTQPTSKLKLLTGENTEEFLKSNIIAQETEGTPIYGTPIESYQKYLGTNISMLRDLDEERAQAQSTADKWGNGAVKMLGTAATSFAEPFVDLSVGVAQAIGTGKISGVYDNVVTQQFDGFNDYLREEFPNYYTKAEEEAGILESLGTANFWADKALNGAGYMLGAIASGAVTGGLGLGARATGATKILQGLGKEFSTGKKVLDIANLTAKEAKLIRAGSAIDNLTASTVGAIGES
jgi:hypothetical protein